MQARDDFQQLHNHTPATQVQQDLERQGYFCGHALSIVLSMSMHQYRPLLLEGEPGVGKTSLAEALSKAYDRPLIRLQCHPALDASSSLYEWNYAAQMLHLKIHERQTNTESISLSSLYTESFLTEKPLLLALRATSQNKAPVLLIDEIDRADADFESLLLEVLSTFQVSIPELGTIQCNYRPWVILTSNRTRELHDALRRRAFYQWLDYPDLLTERRILYAHGVELADQVQSSALHFVRIIRDQLGLYKPPGTSELIDWARTLQLMTVTELNPKHITDTLGVLIKYDDDMAKLTDTMIEQILSSQAPDSDDA